MNTHDGSHVDNASATLAHHDRHTGVDEIECRLQVNCDNGVPLLLTHSQHQAVLSDTSIVDKNVDGAKLLLHLLHDFLGLSKVGSVAGVALCLHAQGLNLGLSLLVDSEVGECDVGAFCGETKCNGLANATCSSCNQSCLTFQ